MSRGRRLGRRAAIALLCAAAGRARPLQNDQAVFRAGVSLVRVDAQVLLGDRPVSDLGKADFIVLDQGRRREVLDVTADRDPLDLLLLLDVSASMRDAIEQVSRVVEKALRQLHDSDRVALATFTSTFRLVVPFSEQRDQIATAVEVLLSQRFDGGTDILRALDECAAEFGRQAQAQRRRAVVLISDGKAPHYFREQQTLDQLWRRDVVVEGLLVKTKSKDSALPLDMDQLTASTGGEAIRADRPGAAFAELMDRVRRRYSIFYALPDGIEGERRTVAVDLTGEARKRLGGGKKLRVNARKGYVWRANLQGAAE